MRKAPFVNIKKDGPGVAVREMEQHGVSTTFVIDGDRKFKGIVSIEDAVELHKKKIKSLDTIIQTDAKSTSPDTPIKQLIGTAIETDHPIAVIDEQGKFLGAVDRASIISEVNLNDPDYVDENEKTDIADNKEEVLK